MKKNIRMIGCLLLLCGAAVLGAVLLLTRHERLVSALGDPSGFEKTLNEKLPFRSVVLSPWQMMMSVTGRRYFADSNLFIDDEGQVLKGSGSVFSIDFASRNIKDLKAYCDATGRNFLYVILPGKPYADDDLIQWGIQCKRNAGADLMAAYFAENEIQYFDARSLFTEDNFYQYFFRTDHHWTPDAGLLTSRALLEQLNEKFGYSFDSESLDESRFARTVIPDRWIGEYGEKALGRFADKDDLILLKPSSPLHFRHRRINASKWQEGDFDILLDKKYINEPDYEGTNLYYTYLPKAGSVEIENTDKQEGNILVIKDSFSNVMLPYMSLEIGHITAWDMRDNREIYAYLEEHPEIETVMIAYTISFVSTSWMNDFQ